MLTIEKYNSILNNASETIKNTDTCDLSRNMDKAKKHYQNFLFERYDNPTIADIAMQEACDSTFLAFPGRVGENLRTLEREPEIDYLAKRADDHIKQIYPKTHVLRDILINDRRVNMIKTTKKASKLYKTFVKILAGNFLH